MRVSASTRAAANARAYGMFGAVTAFKAMKVARRRRSRTSSSPKPSRGREGVADCGELRTDPDGRTRDAKSLRQTGISLRPRSRSEPD